MDASNKITEQEADALARHLKDPQFFKLFEEYAREISNPKAKAENDAYLAQLEAEGQLESIYGQGVQMIQPDPGMVIKTKTRDGGTRVYINVCTCGKVDKLAIEGAKGGGAKGLKMSLPNIIGRTNDKMGKTAADVQFRAFDFTINPDSLMRCLESATLLDAMATMAIEKVEEAAGIKLLRKYKLPAMQYKAVDGEQRPAVMLLRTSAHGEVVEGRLRPHGGPRPLAQAEAGTELQTAPSTVSAENTTARGNLSPPTRQKGSSFSFKPNTRTSGNMQTVPDSSPAADSNEGCCVPQHQVVERARVDLGQAWSDSGRGLQAISNDPEAVIVRVELPGVASAANIELDVTADSISLCVPAKYKLHLPLRYKIDEQLTTAKFDIRKSLMVLTLPVMQAAAGQPAPQPGQHQYMYQVAKSAEQQHVQHDQDTCTHPLSVAAAQAPSVPSVKEASAGQSCVVQAFSLSTCGTQEGSCAGQHDHPAQVLASAAVAPARVQCESPELAHMAASPTGSCTQSPTGSCTQPAGKTDNQLKWEQLHSSAADIKSSVVVGSPSSPQPTATQQCQEPLQAGLQCSMLRPRLSGSRVSAADFV